MIILETTAAQYRASGLNILPASTQTKRPFFSSWKKYQTEKCTTPINEKVTGLAVVCGKISGNLEIIDFDFAGVDFTTWQEEVLKVGGAGYNDVLKTLVIEKTQSGGYHVAYRIETAAAGKNEKLTERVLNPAPCEICVDRDAGTRYINFYGKKVTEGADGRYVVCTIETRGEGGIAIIAPSLGYKVVQNGWLNIPVLPLEVRNVLIEAAQNLNEVTRPVLTRNANPVLYDFNKSGDSFDVAQFLREDDAARKLLIKYGWQFCGTYQGKETWRRPGKARGISGTVDPETSAVYVFTSNAAPLVQGFTYTPLALLAALEYGGDERAAAVDIVKNASGGGEQLYSTPFEVVPVERIETPQEVEEQEQQAAKTIYDIEFPVDCAHPGGYLERVLDYTDAISYREQRSLSFAAAFASFGHLLARRVSYDSKTSPAVYMIAISPPSSGKGAGIEANSKILRVNSNSILEVANQYESIQAFYDRLAVTGKQFLLQDEFGAWLTCVQQERSTGVRTRLLDTWTEIYSKYNDSILPPVSVRKLQESGGTLNPVYSPCFSLYGVTNFAEFRTAFNGRILKNGFIARCSFVVGNNASPLRVPSWEERAKNTRAVDVPKAIIDSVSAWLCFHQSEIAINACPFSVPITRAGYDLLRDYSQAQDAQYLQLDEVKNTAYKTIIGRAGEHAAKYALVFACSQYGPDETRLTIDAESVKKAIAFTEYTHEIYKYLDANEIAEDEEDKSTKDLRRYIAGLCEDTISLATICKIIRSKRLRDLAIVNLENADILERVTIQQEQDGKRVGRPKQVFNINRKNLD